MQNKLRLGMCSELAANTAHVSPQLCLWGKFGSVRMILEAAASDLQIALALLPTRVQYVASVDGKSLPGEREPGRCPRRGTKERHLFGLLVRHHPAGERYFPPSHVQG